MSINVPALTDYPVFHLSKSYVGGKDARSKVKRLCYILISDEHALYYVADCLSSKAYLSASRFTITDDLIPVYIYQEGDRLKLILEDDLGIDDHGKSSTDHVIFSAHSCFFRQMKAVELNHHILATFFDDKFDHLVLPSLKTITDRLQDQLDRSMHKSSGRTRALRGSRGAVDICRIDVTHNQDSSSSRMQPPRPSPSVDLDILQTPTDALKASHTSSSTAALTSAVRVDPDSPTPVSTVAGVSNSKKRQRRISAEGEAFMASLPSLAAQHSRWDEEHRLWAGLSQDIPDVGADSSEEEDMFVGLPKDLSQDERDYLVSLRNPNDICDLCGRQFPRNPSPHLIRLRQQCRQVIAEEQLDPTTWRTQARFGHHCILHRAEIGIVPLVERRRILPPTITHLSLPHRLRSQTVISQLTQICCHPEDSGIFRAFWKKIEEKGWSVRRWLNEEEMTSWIKAGYYGPLGRHIISEVLLQVPTLKDCYTQRQQGGIVWSTFLDYVLIPEAAILLISEDMQQSPMTPLPESAIRARAEKLRAETVQYGDAKFPEEGEDSAKILFELGICQGSA